MPSARAITSLEQVLKACRFVFSVPREEEDVVEQGALGESERERAAEPKANGGLKFSERATLIVLGSTADDYSDALGHELD